MGTACWVHLPGFNAMWSLLCRGHEQKPGNHLLSSSVWGVGSHIPEASESGQMEFERESSPLGAQARWWAREGTCRAGVGGGGGEEVSGIPGLQVLLEPGWMPAAAAPGLESMCRQPRKNQKSKSRRSSVHGCMGCSNVTVYIRVVERVEKRTAHRN